MIFPCVHKVFKADISRPKEIIKQMLQREATLKQLFQGCLLPLFIYRFIITNLEETQSSTAKYSYKKVARVGFEPTTNGL
jgi:hypothetical protein